MNVCQCPLHLLAQWHFKYYHFCQAPYRSFYLFRSFVFLLICAVCKMNVTAHCYSLLTRIFYFTLRAWCWMSCLLNVVKYWWACLFWYLCSSGIKWFFLPWDAVFHDFLSDQAEPLLNLLQLNSHLLWKCCGFLSLETKKGFFPPLRGHGISLLQSPLCVTPADFTLRLFMSRACVRSASSLSAVLMVPCRRRSFSSSFLTTCSCAST